jgi:sigma-E factor negative regulatory protein RseA
MNTKDMAREQISALADGELPEQHVNMVLGTLRQMENKADWEIYHQIGDVLRSDDMAVLLSAGFASRMAARLDAEPAIVAPAVADWTAEQAAEAMRPAKRWAMPSMVAAAAVAAVAFITTPQLMVAMKSEPAIVETAKLASVGPATDQAATVATSGPDGVILRDPGIDDYLLAHQRFSPSVYSTAQYARSATFSNK